VQIHEQRLDRAPELVAGDAGFYSAQGEAEVQNMGVKRVSFPITPPRASSTDDTKSGAGSARDKSGGLVVKGGSAYSSGGTV